MADALPIYANTLRLKGPVKGDVLMEFGMSTDTWEQEVARLVVPESVLDELGRAWSRRNIEQLLNDAGVEQPPPS